MDAKAAAVLQEGDPFGDHLSVGGVATVPVLVPSAPVASIAPARLAVACSEKRAERKGVGMCAIRNSVRASTLLSVLALVCLACPTVALAQASEIPAVSAGKITIVPSKLDKACRRGRATLYDECSDQLGIFEIGTQLAAAENKVLLVSYGAEWCIWCHVFARYIHGEKTRFEYTYGSPAAPEARETSTLFEREKRDVTAEAAALSAYVGRSFVVAHIDGQYANGRAVLERTGAAAFLNGGIPFIFTVDRQGRYAADLDDSVEIRRDTADWYRGYNRRKLLTQLQRMYAAASK